ncbi:MAG: hypothetical protein K9G62_01730 [Alphaproteobacteria bacterium]|nr:hypothetical protein [Alphaproteobacteria bacterium]
MVFDVSVPPPAMKIQWTSAGGVEGQLFTPEGGSHSLILFCTGFPGMGAAVFEQRHAAALCESGYAVYVLRHKGVKLSGRAAPVMVNNAARLMEARRKGETHLGGGPAVIEDWLGEPLEILRALSGDYESIHVIGNSFGALAALWSLSAEEAPLENIKSLIFLAGAQGVSDGTDTCVMRIWKPEFIGFPAITEKVDLGDPAAVAATLEKTYRDMPGRVRRNLPESISLTYVVVEQDELLRLSDTESFRDAIGGRGKIIVDKHNSAWPAYGLLAHDMPDYLTEDLLSILKEKS